MVRRNSPKDSNFPEEGCDSNASTTVCNVLDRPKQPRKLPGDSVTDLDHDPFAYESLQTWEEEALLCYRYPSGLLIMC